MVASVFVLLDNCYGQDAARRQIGERPSPEAGVRAGQRAHGAVRGIVRDAHTGESLIGVHVTLADSGAVDAVLGTVSDVRGRFEIKNLSPGDYAITAHMIGFAPERITVQVDPGAELWLVLKLEVEAVQLAEIVVKPEPRVLTAARHLGLKSLSESQVARAARYDEDIYRAVSRMAGLVSSDFSSQFSIRGGEYDEVLVTLDGLELNNPFHLRDFGGGGMSIVDTGVIGSVRLSKGAFPAAYGEHLSGVMELESAAPGARPMASALGLSLMNARAFTSGRLQNGHTGWMFSGRRGYLDFLLDLTRAYTSYSPNYFDVFGKVTHQFGTKHRVALEGLLAGDKMEYRDATDPRDQVRSSYGNGYLWVNWQAVWNARLLSKTLVSRGNVWRDRKGIDVRRDEKIRFRVNDRRAFHTFHLKQDWTLQLAEDQALKWGFGLKRLQSRYRYSNARLIQDVVRPTSSRKVVNRYAERNTDTDPAGYLMNLYTSRVLRLGAQVHGEAGARMGYASWSGDRYLDPRLKLVWRLRKGSILQGGWGIFHQPQGIDQMYVEDGDQQYYAAERSRHLVLGFEHRREDGLGLSVELYDRKNQNVRPRFVSLAGEAAAFFPELDEDRAFWMPESGHFRGLELVVRKTTDRRLTWQAGYTLSRAVEVVAQKTIPKQFDQRHALFADVDYRPLPRLHVNLSWQYHSGWRYSDVSFDVTYQKQGDVLYDTHYGAFNSRQYPAYHKLDLRVSHLFTIGRQSLAAYVEIRNLYNRKNVRMYRYESLVQEDGTVAFVTAPEYWLPRLPAFGLKWEIGG